MLEAAFLSPPALTESTLSRDQFRSSWRRSVGEQFPVTLSVQPSSSWHHWAPPESHCPPWPQLYHHTSQSCYAQQSSDQSPDTWSRTLLCLHSTSTREWIFPAWLWYQTRYLESTNQRLVKFVSTNQKRELTNFWQRNGCWGWTGDNSREDAVNHLNEGETLTCSLPLVISINIFTVPLEKKVWHQLWPIKWEHYQPIKWE